MFLQTRLALAAAFITCALTMPALCQSEAEYQVACQDDALRFCNDYVPDHAKIKSCLLAHKASLSPACRALLIPAQKKKRK